MNNKEIHIESSINDKVYKNIIFQENYNPKELENTIISVITYFFNYLEIPKNAYILVVGLGNDNHTADSVGPKVLKYVSVNSYLKGIVDINSPTISALEPGVLLETGIKTEEIIKGVIEKIIPDLVILVDAFISTDIEYLNRSIMISDVGIHTGTSIIGLSSDLDEHTLGVKTLAIGVTTAIETKVNDTAYILTSKNIDEYVLSISKIIGTSLNNAFKKLK